MDAPACALPNLPCRADDIGVYGVPSYQELREFWNACRPWFAERGIVLYDIHAPDPCDPRQDTFWACTSTSTPAALPHAVLMNDEVPSPQIEFTISRLAYAQDFMHCNVVLKLVDNGSAEHEIYRCIQQTPTPFTDSTQFPCVLPPLAILDTPYEYSLIVMPMWGSPICLVDMETVEEVLNFIECLLRGLKYLHNLRIAHRDICEHNIVVNCHSPGVEGEPYREMLRKHCRGGGVLYALMDYDQSLRLPQDTSLTSCRRPASESSAGAAWYKPTDIDLGEPYYNPFAFDVGATGYLFRRFFVEAVVAVPGLAALFDRMTDHSISRRPTAEEALTFFGDVKSNVSRETLETRVALKSSFEAMNDADIYWSKLSPEDLLLWGHYRTPPRPFFQRMLDWFTSFPTGWKVTSFVRRVLQV
ncbi:hypothetical protein BV20DRAFT_996622 [Pilatotrama ljubarskyi]|nr:hypothetical protein BV20DRAFT_996622 [Pilatotrama ljubarskyi]